MNQRPIADWSTLRGACVEIRQDGLPVSRGTVDDVTDDGSILWLHSATDGRRLFEKSNFYQAWAIEERVGFHYRVCASEQRLAEQLTDKHHISV